MVEKINYTNKEVELAIGKEDGLWYVQTTDLHEETEYSEHVIDGVSYVHALSALKRAMVKYDMGYQNWSSKNVEEDLKYVK